MDWFLVIVAAVSALASYILYRTSKPKNFPPSPTGIPFLGNILSLGSQPHLTILEWKEQYGDVFSFYNGRKPVVIISNFDTVRKVFTDDVAAGRMTISQIRNDPAVLPLGIGLISSEGNLWKSHRRFALSTLRDLGMGKNWLEDTIIAEVEDICQALKNAKGKPFDPKIQLTNSVSNVICALIFGKRFSLTDPKFSRLTSLISENIGAIKLDFVVQTMPFLLWFPNFVRTKIFKARLNVVALTEFLKERVREHAAVADYRTEAQDYLYAYQRETETGLKMGSRDTFSNELQLIGSLFDLFAAGTETTSTTTLWALVFMVENPDIMRKVQDEIDTNVGRERNLTNADRAFLPFTEAVILEVQRCANLVPLGVPHRTHEEITVEGFTIPKDTMIAANLFSIHRDPRWWKNPEVFDPHRFLDENMKLTRPDGFIPFSIGKRACLGEALAKMELFLFIANLLRAFTLELPTGKTLSHNDYSSSIVLSPNPFELIFVPRV